jgi:hypothetical protein
MTVLATREDYDLPHIDWLCKECGGVYVSTGVPDETRCYEGHAAGWRPHPEQVEDYIDTLESLAPGDGIVIAGSGPVPLMGRVEETADGWLRTEELDSPAREVRWSRNGDDPPTVEWRQADDEHAVYSDVHHVETVEVLD